MSSQWSYQRPLFNYDYVLAALIYIWVSRALAAGVLVFLFFLKAARYMIPTYFCRNRHSTFFY